MLELLILAALVVWLVFALRSCFRRRGKGCGGCDGNCGHCGQSGGFGTQDARSHRQEGDTCLFSQGFFFR